jgi:hypothetical protein
MEAAVTQGECHAFIALLKPTLKEKLISANQDDITTDNIIWDLLPAKA